MATMSINRTYGKITGIAHTGELKMLWPRQENTIQKTII
jgi:hypothetical protein